MKASKTRMLAVNAVLAAMCAVLGAISLDVGNLKLTFEGLPVLIAALLFGPWDAIAVGGIGTLLYQVLRYGVSVTTPLWILPYIVCGLVVGLYAKRRSYALSRKQMGFIICLSSLLVLVLNTLALYVDSKVYGYYSAIYIFGSLPARIAIAIAKAAVFTLVMPTILKAARRSQSKSGTIDLSAIKTDSAPRPLSGAARQLSPRGEPSGGMALTATRGEPSGNGADRNKGRAGGAEVISEE